MHAKSEENMLEYQLGLYLYSLREGLSSGTMEIHNTFYNGMTEMLDEWQDKYHDAINEHFRLEE